MVTINFYGSGIRYWICEIPLEEFKVLENDREKLETVWEQLFFDLEYLEEKGYDSWESIHLLEKGKGWLMADRNRMEIRIGRKKRTVTMNDFLGEDALFDPYKKEVIAFEIEKREGYQYVLLVQMDTGTINKYQLERSSIDTDRLLFRFYDGRAAGLDLLWLTSVEYDGQELFDQRDDCLTRQNMVRIL